MESAMDPCSNTMAALQCFAHLQLLMFECLPVDRGLSSQQHATLCEGVQVEHTLLLMVLEGDTVQMTLTTGTELVQAIQQTMALLPVGGEGWRAGLDELRGVLTQQREMQDGIQQDADVAFKGAQDHLDAVHAVFALPEVERTTDLPPELIGLIGEFLSADANPADYVSIYALPQLSEPSALEDEDSSSSASAIRHGSVFSTAPPDEAEEREPASVQMEEDE
jgi:hypothetical protein